MEAQLQRSSVQEENPQHVVSSHPGGHEQQQQPVTGTNLPMQTGFDSEEPTYERENRRAGNVFKDADDQCSSMRDHKSMTTPHQAKEPEAIGTHEPEKKNNNIRQSSKPDVMEIEEEGHVMNPVVRIGKLEELEEDPHSPRVDTSPSNYQTKEVDPTGQGGKEADVDALIRGLKNVLVSTGESDQSASTKNVVAPRLEHGGQPQETSSEINAPLKESASGHQQEGRGGNAASKGFDKGIRVRNYLSEKLKPGNEDKVLSEAIADKLYMKKKRQPHVVENIERSSSSNSTGVVGRLKGVVGSWLGTRS